MDPTSWLVTRTPPPRPSATLAAEANSTNVARRRSLRVAAIAATPDLKRRREGAGVELARDVELETIPMLPWRENERKKIEK